MDKNELEDVMMHGVSVLSGHRSDAPAPDELAEAIAAACSAA